MVPSRIEKAAKHTLWVSALLALPLLVAGVSPAAGPQGTAAPVPLKHEQTVTCSADREKVLAVVEHRTKDERVVAKIREKLSAMSGRELRLAVSLCDRISRIDDSAGADIAFSIVMAMVVLS